MRSQKGSEGVSIVQAVDTLSHMAEVDMATSDHKRTEGLTPDQIQEKMLDTTWLDPSHTVYNQERVKETFKIILSYLKELVEKDKAQLANEQTQRGIQAIVLLATEAAEKLDRCTDLFKSEDTRVLDLKEYKDLMKFYQTKVLHRFQEVPEAYGNWHEDWGKTDADELLNVQKRGLKDLTTVRSDKEYELFYIRREDGRPFFNRNLLRHIHLVGKFDVLIIDPSRDDLFLRMRLLKDRESHHAAQEILQGGAQSIEEYFKESMKHKQNSCVAALNMALMALMLAGNTSNLMQNTNGKSSTHYFKDFHLYFRKALQSDEYKALTAKKKHTDPFTATLFNMIHTVCSLFFLNSPQKKEAVKFIDSLIKRGEQEGRTQKETQSPTALFNNLADDDEQIRATMRHYPNGPLMKTLEVFNKEEEMSGYDPFMEGNTPHQLYTMVGSDLHITCLRLPAPLSQKFIRSASLLEEFTGFLQALKGQKHLLINLQDRTSWQEHARAVALEEIHSEHVMVVTLPKCGDFYWQASAYYNVEGADTFMQQLAEQVASGEQCGFHFPKEIEIKQINAFAKHAISLIHTLFFGSKEILTHKNRLDFIEIFYLVLSLKIIEITGCDSVSFTCKDAIDTGMAHSCEQFLFLRLMNDASALNPREKDLLYWMLYSPALMNRWRVVDQRALGRLRGALGVIGAELEAHRPEVLSGCSSLFKFPFFKSLKIS